MKVAPPPAKRLLESAPALPKSRHRSPIAVSVAIAVVLLVAGLFVETAIARAARLAVRGQVGVVSDALRRETSTLGHPVDGADLARFLALYATEGLRYVAVLRADGTVAPAAGEALGSGTHAEPIRVGKRVRLALPPDHAGNVLVVELEPTAANDIFMAGRIVLLVIGGADVLLIALGVRFSRTLRAREELAARLEAERQLAALGEMSAVLAHELRNPLTSLKGNAQLLAEVLPPETPQGKKADRVVKEAVRLERLTNDLLELVRTGAVRRKRVDPREVIDASILAFGMDRIDKRYEALAERDLDPDRLRVALENVVRNATQADTGTVEVSARDDDGALVITVRDHGAGIPAGDEEAIFKPFRTGKAQGTGLGLAIARRILELHGGSIRGSNHADGGAVFTMTIPSAREK